MREGLCHQLVFRCLVKICDAATDVKPKVETATRKGWKEDPRHPLIYRLMKPNEQQVWSEFISSVLIDLHVYGRSYVRVIRGRNDEVISFMPIDPRLVIEIREGGRREAGPFNWHQFPEALGEIVGYQVQEALGAYDLKPEDMIATYDFDPSGPMSGMSSLGVALNGVGLLHSMNRYARNYLNEGGPSSVIMIKGRKLKDEAEAEMIRQRFAQRYYGGGKRSAVAVFDDDASFEKFGGDIKDILNEPLLFSEEAGICAAFGVPPILAGAYVGLRWANQRAGQAGAQKDFWENKMSPLMARMRDIFTYKFLEKYEQRVDLGVKVRVNWDLTNVQALKEDEDKVAARYRADYNGGIITLNEARTARGFDPVALPEADLTKLEIEMQRAQENPEETSDDNSLPKSFSLRWFLKDVDFKKSYEWQGYLLSREPTEEEKKIIPLVAEAQESAADALLTLCSEARNELIRLAAVEAAKTDDYQSIKVDLSEGLKKKMRQAIAAGYEAGYLTVIPEKRGRLSLKVDEDIAGNNRILGALVRALINQVIARFVSSLLRRLMRDVQKEAAIAEAETEIRAESTAYIAELALGASVQAVADGRYDAFAAAAEIGDLFIYSSVLDANTCTVCKEDDQKQSLVLNDLPTVPNPDCLGRWRCRCMIIIAHQTEAED